MNDCSAYLQIIFDKPHDEAVQMLAKFLSTLPKEKLLAVKQFLDTLKAVERRCRL